MHPLPIVQGWLHSILYVLFENAMGVVKLWAVIAGILDLKQAQEWVVTTKLGASDKRPGTQVRAARGGMPAGRPAMPLCGTWEAG